MESATNTPTTDASATGPADGSGSTGASAATATPGASGGTTVRAATEGRTIIDDTVVAKVVGIAARAVPGVFALGGNAARALGVIRDAVGTSALAQGVRVEVGEDRVALDVTIVVDYPAPVLPVASAVRAAVADAVSDLVGLEVTEVDVTVADVNVADAIVNVADVADVADDVADADVTVRALDGASDEPEGRLR